MKNIFNILKFDLKNVAKSIIVFVVVIGICILPALYSWFNIAANWDPYSNTAELSFAVCSNDEGYTYKSISINAGDEIVTNLKANRKMGWDFVSEKEAVDGVKKGKYYAAVVVPKDFSKNLFSITTGDFKKAKIKYYSNEKPNAIAPKITDKGAEAIESSVNTTYVDKITDVIATALNMTENELSDSKVKTINKVITTLKDTKVDLAEFKKTNDLFITTLDSINTLLQSNIDLGPALKSTLSKAGAMSEDIKNTLNGLSTTSDQITDSVLSILGQGSDYIADVDSELGKAFAEISTDANGAADRLSNITSINKKIIEINDKVLAILEKIQKSFPNIDVSDLITKINNLNDKQNNIITKINNACDTLRKTGKLPSDVQNDLKSLVSGAKADISTITTDFSGKVKSKVDSAAQKTYSALGDVSDFVATVGDTGKALTDTLNTGKTVTDNLKAAFKNINEIIDNADKKIDSLITKLRNLKNNNTVENFLTPIIVDPEKLADFVSSPVNVDKVRLYAIENYGSAMTPFYTSLGLWVGGVVLVAVISVSFSKRQLKTLNKPKDWQLFFGRYLFFFILSQIQALVISLGDLLFLKIQCASPVLFVVTSLISSFVYSLIIYALTITFSVLGKALAVIILVIQVAGSGGTFPIEVLPGPFKAIAPFLPFRYGINAMRECVAGVDIGAYWRDIGTLCLFALGALFIGLFLRKPCIKVIEFFNNRVEDSDIVI